MSCPPASVNSQINTSRAEERCFGGHFVPILTLCASRVTFERAEDRASIRALSGGGARSRRPAGSAGFGREKVALRAIARAPFLRRGSKNSPKCRNGHVVWPLTIRQTEESSRPAWSEMSTHTLRHWALFRLAWMNSECGPDSQLLR